MNLNTSDPLTFFLIVLAVGIVLVGMYFALREVIADAILLADKKREAEKQERNRRP